jgi:hypothetical protein
VLSIPTACYSPILFVALGIKANSVPGAMGSHADLSLLSEALQEDLQHFRTQERHLYMLAQEDHQFHSPLTSEKGIEEWIHDPDGTNTQPPVEYT